jgi:hypothetical protein
MTKRERRQQLMAEVEAGITDVFIRQRCPWTFVDIAVRMNDKIYDAFDFAKVQWPDTFDADTGVERAKRKAIARIAKQIMEEGGGE